MATGAFAKNQKHTACHGSFFQILQYSMKALKEN